MRLTENQENLDGPDRSPGPVWPGIYVILHLKGSESSINTYFIQRSREGVVTDCEWQLSVSSGEAEDLLFRVTKTCSSEACRGISGRWITRRRAWIRVVKLNWW
jgi:hypothetical protein